MKSNSQTILVIEDEPAIADAICYALKREGYDTAWMTLGRDGINEFKKKPYALIVLDVGLPDMSGFEVCREVRITAQTPIIFLTARTEEIDRVVGLEMGADDYMAKPFSPRELVARVRAVLRRFRESPAIRTSAAKKSSTNGFVVDENKFAIAFHGKPLELSATEFKILKLLVSQPGRVFTRDQILDAAWDDPGASTDRTIDAHIKNIRNELRRTSPNKKDPIITHRGIGYSIEEDS